MNVILAAIVVLTTGGQAQAPVASARDLAEVRRLINAGEPQKAIERLQALTSDSGAASQTQVALLLGVAYYHAADPAKAAATLASIVDRFPPDSLERREADQILGLSLVVIGKFADAISSMAPRTATRSWGSS